MRKLQWKVGVQFKNLTILTSFLTGASKLALHISFREEILTYQSYEPAVFCGTAILFSTERLGKDGLFCGTFGPRKMFELLHTPHVPDVCT